MRVTGLAAVTFEVRSTRIHVQPQLPYYNIKD